MTYIILYVSTFGASEEKLRKQAEISSKKGINKNTRLQLTNMEHKSSHLWEIVMLMFLQGSNSMSVLIQTRLHDGGRYLR